MVAGQLRHGLTPSRSQIAPSRSCCVPRSDRRQALKVSASAKPSHAPAEAVASRRDALIAAGAAAAVPLLTGASPANAGQQTIKISNLSVFQKASQLQFLVERAQLELKKDLTAADRPTAWRLLFNDAATYNVQTGKGGVNGSVILDGELGRKANKDLKPYVEKLRKAKKAIDQRGAQEGQAPVTWADLIVIGAKVATLLEWNEIKEKRNPKGEGGVSVANLFGAEWQIQLGREDATQPDPEVPIPTTDSSVDEIRDFLYQLGNKTPEGGLKAFFSGKPPFYERPGFVVWTYAQPDPAKAEAKLGADSRFAPYKNQYDRSRETLTRAEYEVDTIQYFSELSSLGAKFNRDRYYFDVKVDLPDIR